MRVLPLRLTNPMALTVYLFFVAHSLFLCSSVSTWFASGNDVPKCGDFEFSYPFGQKNRGLGDPDFQIQCDRDGNPLINIGGDDYRILEAPCWTNHTMRIINNNLWDGKCNLSGNYSQFWLPASHFHIADAYTNLTIWALCDQSNGEFSQVRLRKLCSDDWYYDIWRPEEGTRFCKTQLQLPIDKEFLHFNMNQNFSFHEGFEVTWHVDPNRYQSCGVCMNSYGNCGYNISEPSSRFLCYCPDGSTHPDKCPEDGRFPDKCPDQLCSHAGTEDTGGQNMSAIAIGCFVVGVAVAAIGLAVAVFLMYDAYKSRSPPPPNGNNVVNPPYSSAKPESSLFASTENSSFTEV